MPLTCDLTVDSVMRSSRATCLLARPRATRCRTSISRRESTSCPSTRRTIRAAVCAGTVTWPAPAPRIVQQVRGRTGPNRLDRRGVLVDTGHDDDLRVPELRPNHPGGGDAIHGERKQVDQD